MQAQTPEVSAEQATTPTADLRLVSVEQLKKIHRELDACQKVIWLAGCRPRVPNGFDPAYVTGAQEQLKVIEDLMTQEPSWTHAKPTQPGAYWIRGNSLEEPALIQVKKDCGELWCNLHMSTTEPDFGHGYCITQLSDQFEWIGPLGSAPASQVDEPPVGKNDPLYREAVESVVQNQRASVSFLQRRLGIGYNRAARMIEAMEAASIVSGMNNDGARAVLVLEVPHA